MALWYPQMGGYGGLCIVEKMGDTCFDVYVWHDGEFPLGGIEQPYELHHCDADQFIRFGEQVKRKLFGGGT